MTPTKRFLLGFLGVALIGWLAGILLFGPPGLSAEYLAQYHHDHEHYVDITKSDLYKRYVERPALHGPEQLNEHDAHLLNSYLPFVEAYEARPEFQAEQHRIHRLGLYFEFFNPLLVVLLVWRFARKPLQGFLDGQIAALRTRLEEAAQARAEAAARLREAEVRQAGLEAERQQVREDTEARMQRELAELERSNQASLRAMERELEERKQAELDRATLNLKRELVDAAIAEVMQELQSKPDPAIHEHLLGQFLAGLERRA